MKEPVDEECPEFMTVVELEDARLSFFEVGVQNAGEVRAGSRQNGSWENVWVILFGALPNVDGHVGGVAQLELTVDHQ